MLRAHRLRVDLEPFEHEARLLERAGHQAERLGQHDPFDLPRAGRALVVGDHRVHQRGGMLAHHRDRGVDVAARDRVALLRHRAARAAAVRERLVDLADLGLHHQLDVHAELAERAADEAEEGADLGDVVADRVPGDHRLLQARARRTGRPASPSRPSRATPACRRRRRTRRPARAAFSCARRSRWRSIADSRPGHLVAEGHRNRLLQVAAADHRRVSGAACACLASAAEIAASSRSTMREAFADLQHRRGVGDVLRRRAPVAVLAELVAAQRVELRHDAEDRVADALGLLAQLGHVDLVESAVADDLVGRLLRNEAEPALHLGQRGLDVEVLLRCGSRRTRPGASRRWRRCPGRWRSR